MKTDGPFHSVGARLLAAGVCLVTGAGAACATTYYVSLNGSDDNAGTAMTAAWKTVAKVNATAFQPGDAILFECGGEWHESLNASSSGSPGSPITYDQYGVGARPRFWGSDVLDKQKFTPAGEKQYAYPIAIQADSALADHAFIPSAWQDGTLTITSDTDPRTDSRIYTACLRGNVVFSNYKSHLVFRNLVADETAGQLNEGNTQGYGFRLQGGVDVLVEDCEANRCGRHNFGAINVSEFVGRRLSAEYAQPNTPGGNTFYVSYADAGAPAASCSRQWIDCTADHMENGGGGKRLFFVSHGERQGPILFSNVTARSKISVVDHSPLRVLGGTLLEDASIELFTSGGILVDGLTLKDSSAIDNYSANCTVQNCVVDLTPKGGGPTGYGVALLCRNSPAVKNSIFRFNTIASKNFGGIRVEALDSQTQIYGNIFANDGEVVHFAKDAPTPSDLPLAGHNFYPDKASFNGKPLAQWQALGFDTNSLSGNPEFVSPAAGDYRLSATSPCIDRGTNCADVARDHDGRPRPVAGTGRGQAVSDIGAYEYSGSPITAKQTGAASAADAQTRRPRLRPGGPRR